jgi:hypothetical protein
VSETEAALIKEDTDKHKINDLSESITSILSLAKLFPAKLWLGKYAGL